MWVVKLDLGQPSRNSIRGKTARQPDASLRASSSCTHSSEIARLCQGDFCRAVYVVLVRPGPVADPLMFGPPAIPQPEGLAPGSHRVTIRGLFALDELLPVAREVSDHLHCDDTSARHGGQPAVCTHIGNEWFASFTTTDSKSRLMNFLRLLCRPVEQYRWCEEALVALELYGAGKQSQQRLAGQSEGCWLGRDVWEQQLTDWNTRR